MHMVDEQPPNPPAALPPSSGVGGSSITPETASSAAAPNSELAPPPDFKGKAAGGLGGLFPVRVCATPAEREATMRIRIAVFVDEQRVPPELEPDEYDEGAVHLLAVEAETEKPAGTARVVDKGNGVAKIGRVAVLPEFRGRRVGDAVMQAALAEARRLGASVAVLDAQVPVIPFYERLGFVAQGPVFDDAGIPHRHMTLPLPKADA